MNAARSAIRVFALASIAATVALTVTETPGQVTQSWATILDDGGRSDKGKLVALDPAGDIVVGGVSSGVGGIYLRLAKIDPSGTVIWSQRFASDTFGNSLAITGLAVDGAGDILAVCNEQGSLAGATTVKVSSTGRELWRATYDTPGVDLPVGIEVDAAGRSFVGGTTELQEPTQRLVNAFIVSYDANGSLLWQDRYDRKHDHERIYDIARDPVGGAVYLAGELNAQSGAQSPLLLCYDPDGRRRWAKRYQERPGTYGFTQKVAVGPDGNVALAGFLSTGAVDIQVIKVDAFSGKDLWSAVYEAPTYDQVIDLAIDGSGNVFVSGHMETEPPIVRQVSACLIRYAPDGVPSWTVTDDRIDTLPGALAVDASGSAYVASTRNVPIGYLSTRHWLTTRYDAAGQQVWTAEYDGNPGGLVDGSANDLALTSAGDVIVVGTVNGDIHVVSYRQP